MDAIGNIDRRLPTADRGQVGGTSSTGVTSRKATSPEEAAQQFEEVLVRQFVKEMTKDLFKQSLSGDDGPGWMASQADTQRDILTDVLTKHLVESDALQISDLLLRQWGRTGTAPTLPEDQP